MTLHDDLGRVIDAHARHLDRWGPFDRHPAGAVAPDVQHAALEELLERLADTYPFGHPRYAGQMLKPPHDVAVLGYVAAMLHNPNNHALDGGPSTSAMEEELVPELAALFGLPPSSLGHLTSSGTVANLEALFVARELHPDRAVAFGPEAHYTHGRMSHLLGLATHPLPVDDRGRLDVEGVAAACASGAVGTVVVTAGTTALGMVDPIDEIVPIARRFGVRVHVDAAYGGFFTILARSPGDQPLVPVGPFLAIAECDSVVVDPHKHGLQPYGCGAVLFRDPTVARFYGHDSAYTYFSSDERHLGEISLECSRSGAAAAALWLTRRVIPWTPEGLGAVLAAGLRGATRFRSRLVASTALQLYQEGDLDIVAFLPRRASSDDVDRASAALYEEAMATGDASVFLASFTVTGAALASRLGWPAPAPEDEGRPVRILRSVVMKPEHELVIDGLADQLELVAARLAH